MVWVVSQGSTTGGWNCEPSNNIAADGMMGSYGWYLKADASQDGLLNEGFWI